MNKPAFLKFWSIAMGSMDALTGLLLVFVPDRVLGLLNVPRPSADALDFVSWIGVFVLSVGLCYGLALTGKRSKGEAAWMFTSLVRILVAVFLTSRIVAGFMDPAWIVVAAADALVAMVQIFVLRKGWWKEAPR